MSSSTFFASQQAISEKRNEISASVTQVIAAAHDKLISTGRHTLEPQGRLPTHSLADRDLIFYVTKGSGVLSMGGADTTIETRDTVAIAAGTQHSLSNDGEQELCWLWFSLPNAGARGSCIVKQSEQISYWQSAPATGHAEVILSPAQFSPGFSMGTQTLDPGMLIPPHAHLVNEEVLVVLDGQGKLLTSEGELPLTAGDAAYAFPEHEHGFRASDESSMTVLWCFTPPGLENVLAGLGRARQPGEPSPGVFPPPKNVFDILAEGGFAPLSNQ